MPHIFSLDPPQNESGDALVSHPSCVSGTSNLDSLNDYSRHFFYAAVTLCDCCLWAPCINYHTCQSTEELSISMLTRFSLHSCRNCRNFLVVRRFALPIAERILPCTVNVNAITTVHFARNSHCMHQLKHQHLAVQLATVTRSTVLKLRLDCMLLLRHFAKKNMSVLWKSGDAVTS